MGLLITAYANLVNVWKTSGEAGKQRVKKAQREEIIHHFRHAPNKSLVTKKLFSDGNEDKNWIYGRHTSQG